MTDLQVFEGKTAIAVFVDRLSKMVHFAPCTKEVTIEQYAQLFIDHVFRLHGMPEVIISNRDPRFTSKFWTKLFQILGTDLQYSTAFHPQTDGQSEVTIRVLENFLRPYVEQNPSTWVAQLGLMEFTANNAVNTSTGFTPFYLNCGEDPVLPNTLMVYRESEASQAVTETVDRIKVALGDAKTNLTAAQQRSKRQADRSRREEMFEVGDEVVLSTKHLRGYAPHLPMKLKRRWIGPFPITKVVSPVTYRLDLPPMWQVHPTFHVSNLKRYFRSPDFVREVKSPPPVLVDGELEYEVEAIVRHRGQGARRQYLVQWKGYPLHEATWEPASHLTNVGELLAEYLRRVRAQEEAQQQGTLQRTRGRRST